MTKRLFKYYPEDFGQLTVKVLHMDVDFDVYENHTKVVSKLKVKTLQPIKELTLNASNLEVHSVTCDKGDCIHESQKEKDLLTVKFNEEVSECSELTIITETTCRPTANVLEGLYYDETPKGCPCQQITQCQQWGFCTH